MKKYTKNFLFNSLKLNTKILEKTFQKIKKFDYTLSIKDKKFYWDLHILDDMNDKITALEFEVFYDEFSYSCTLFCYNKQLTTIGSYIIEDTDTDTDSWNNNLFINKKLFEDINKIKNIDEMLEIFDYINQIFIEKFSNIWNKNISKEFNFPVFLHFHDRLEWFDLNKKAWLTEDKFYKIIEKS